MSKVIISPIERYKGSVVIADPLTIPQAQAVEAGFDVDSDELIDARRNFLDAVEKYGDTNEKTVELKSKFVAVFLSEKKGVFFSDNDEKHSPAILACIEKWNIDNFSLTATGQLPASPRKHTHELIDWLFSEIKKVYFGELEIPNESKPTPSDTPLATGEAQS